MRTVERRIENAFAVWVTGLPASGKSTLVAAVVARLAARGLDVAVLESDVLRKIFAGQPNYDQEGRDAFYRQMIYVGTLLTEHGVPVIFDATANRRCYRDQARERIPRFLEVYMDCPLEICMARDPKGTYRQALEGTASTVPGLQAVYEPPGNPDLIVRSDKEDPAAAAERVIQTLAGKGYL
jgi:adenylylsulfate kinase